MQQKSDDDASKDKKRVSKIKDTSIIEAQIKEKKKKEENKMKKTMKIEGLMCGHCEARAKKVLEALEQVDEAVVSHVEGTAIVTLNAEIADSELKRVIEEQDYKVIEII